MKIGLSYITQIRGGEDSGQLVPESDASPLRALGGWIALTFNQLVAALISGYHTEHNADDTHSIIHASGAISERGRTTPMGVWINVPFIASDFSGDTAMTWTVDAADVATWAYTLVGNTMTVAWYLTNTTVGGTPSTYLRIKVPAEKQVVRLTYNASLYIDNGGASTVGYAGAGRISGTTPLNYIHLVKAGGANWTATTNATSTWGQISFEVA